MAKRRVPPPVPHAEVAKRARLKASGRAEPTRLPLLDVPLDGLSEVSVSMERGRLRVVADVGVQGLKRRRAQGLIPATRLDERDVAEIRRKDLEGVLPSGVHTSFVPRKARPTHRLPAGKGTDVDRGGTIFGTDDRYLFDDTSFPWRTTGKVRTEGQWGSGVTIGPRLVLTASHVINWIQAPGSLSDDQTAFDYVVLVMAERIGDVVGYPGYRTYDDRWNGGSYWQYVGYPGDLSSGERPAFQGDGVVSSVGEHSTSGQTGYVMGHFNEFTPGQSGGIAWGWWGDEPWPRVVDVGSTIGCTAVQTPTGSTTGDNEYGGGPALSALIGWARASFA